jgi:hypothetical protein
MYKQDSIRQVLMDYKITITNTKMARRHRPVSYSAMNIVDYDAYMQIEEETVPILLAEIPEKEFAVMADALCEMRDLMRDPETARLLMEARFINRLKGNR